MVKVGEARAVRETNGQRVIRNAIDRFAFGSKEIPEAVEFSGLRRVSYLGERLEEMKPCSVTCRENNQLVVKEMGVTFR